MSKRRRHNHTFHLPAPRFKHPRVESSKSPIAAKVPSDRLKTLRKDLAEVLLTLDLEKTDLKAMKKVFDFVYGFILQFSHLYFDGRTCVPQDQVMMNVEFINHKEFREVLKRAKSSQNLEDVKVLLSHGTCFTLRFIL
jgi:hypothetical protein